MSGRLLMFSLLGHITNKKFQSEVVQGSKEQTQIAYQNTNKTANI